MPTIQDFFSLQINLDSSPAVATKYSLPILLVDHADVPVYTRVRQVTPATYTTRLTADSEQYNFFERFYAQNYPTNPANSRKNIAGYVGRWVSAATKAVRIFPNASSTITDWTTLAAAGKFNITDGVNPEDISPDFTGDTDMDDVAASITAAFVASTNYKTYVCSIDALDNLVITGAVAGAASLSFVLAAGATGTDMTSATYFGNATAYDQAGLDAETLAAAAVACFAKNNVPTIVFERGATDVQALEFITAMDAIDGKFSVVVTVDPYHAESTGIAYSANALDLGKCHVIYSRQDDDIDAAAYGENLPQDEGTVDYAINSLVGVSASEFEADGVTVAEMSEAAVEASDAVNCDFVTTPYTVTHLARGLCPNGDEVRIVILKMWAEYNTSLEGYEFMLANNVNTFTEVFLGGVKGIIEKYMDACVDRNGIESGYTINMPSASDFTAIQKASHTMTLSDVVTAGIQFAVNNVFASSTWSAQ